MSTPLERAAGVLDAGLDLLIVPSFTRLGPAVRRKLFHWEAPDVAGRVIAVTGPTSGLGKATVERLAEGGAHLVLLARNPDKAAELVVDLERRGAESVAFVEVDLADAEALDRAGAELGGLDRLDALVHNGGALFNDRRVTDDGIEMTLAVHVLAPYTLTALARPALRRGHDPRVVTVSSGGMYSKAIDLDDVQNERGYTGSGAYAKAKRMQIVMTQYWAEQLASDGIGAHAMHPGWAATPGVTESLPGFEKVMKPLLRTADEGADTIVWLTSAPGSELGTGGFWLDRRRRPTAYLPGTATSPTDSARLIAVIHTLVAARSDQVTD